MKKLLIAGYQSQTENYQKAFSLLGAACQTLPDPPKTLSASLLSPDNPPPYPSLYDGLVLPGGGDIAPYLFHQGNQGSRNVDEALDRAQLFLFQAFLEAEKPILGICKGLQIINVGLGGTIIQDLREPSLSRHAWDKADKLHPTKAASGTFPALLYGRHPVVNSAHHQAVGAVGCGLRVAQYASDFVIEAMYHERLPIFGVQWHPERLCFSHANKEAADGEKLLQYFLQYT